MAKTLSKYSCWIALACLVVPMFASYYFDDMFSTLSHLFENPSMLQLGWNSADYGLYTSGYSVLCVFGGLVVCGMLLDKWGVRVTGSIFVTMMTGGAALVTYALTSGLPPKTSLTIAYVGCMFFGLGSEIAGVAVTRSIAKWFKDRNMAFAMGLQLAIARLGTAFALVISPKLVAEKAAGQTYSLMETAEPAFLGLGLMLVGMVLWAIFVAMDARFDHQAGLKDTVETAEEDKFRFSDVVKLLKNRHFIVIALLCVFFYSSVVSFKKFASAILIPRFDVPVEAASWMVSMLPFATVVFAPIFGLLVDKIGHGTRWMLTGAVLALMLAFAPSGIPFYGYLSMVFLGFGYSLVPAAMWPSVTKIVPNKVLGTAYSLIYWVQNLGLMSFKMFAGKILADTNLDKGVSEAGAFWVEVMFVAVCVVALLLALSLSVYSRRNPHLKMDVPDRAVK